MFAAVRKLSFPSQIGNGLPAIHGATDEPEMLEPLKRQLEQQSIILGIIGQNGQIPSLERGCHRVESCRSQPAQQLGYSPQKRPGQFSFFNLQSALRIPLSCPLPLRPLPQCPSFSTPLPLRQKQDQTFTRSSRLQ